MQMQIQLQCKCYLLLMHTSDVVDMFTANACICDIDVIHAYVVAFDVYHASNPYVDIADVDTTSYH